jgi:hypothetical protein
MLEQHLRKYPSYKMAVARKQGKDPKTVPLQYDHQPEH